jgi:trk system potassium uptake protein TrkA
MHILIIGGGKTGAYLGQLLAEAGHSLTIIEQRPEVLARLRAEIPHATVIAGDGSSPRILREAQVHRANAVAAVTGNDEDNLVIALQARDEFKVPRVIARVNNPKNAWLFTQAMGVDAAVNQAGIMAQLIQEEISVGEMVMLLKLRRGELTLVEEQLVPSSPAVGKTVDALQLPNDAVLIAIIRKGTVLLPQANTVLEAEDELLALTKTGSESALAVLLR